MITREEILDFAEFCYDNYNIKIPPAVIETYIKNNDFIKSKWKQCVI